MATAAQEVFSHITKNPRVCGGKACIDNTRISDETWARLAEHLDERQLIEVVFTVGTYTCLAMAFNSFGLQLDPELQPEE